jgi:hypothetical protein
MEIEIIYGDLPALGTERLVLVKAMVVNEKHQDLKLDTIIKGMVSSRCIR